MKISSYHIPEENNPIDYDLHGIVGIRLLNPAPGDVKAVDSQLGPIRSSLSREPDIIIEFVDRLHYASPLLYLGSEEYGFTKDAFLILTSQHKHARVQIPMEKVGSRCKILCETNLAAVPLLIAILNLTALAKGVLPIHASAFSYKNTGVLSTGWSKGGKTETLLAFMAQGAIYIGDEWIYISRDAKSMAGIPQPLRIWDWHLQSLPLFQKKVSFGDITRIKTIKFLQAIDNFLLRSPFRNLFSKSTNNKIRALLKRQLYVDLPPQTLFGQESMHLSGSLEKVFFVASHEKSDLTLCQIDAQEVAERMVHSLQYEYLTFMSYYQAFRFAFPELKNELIEQLEHLHKERLIHALSGKETFALYHPYPVSLPAIFETMNSVF